MLVLGYMTIFTVLEVLIFPRWKKHTSIHSSDFKQQGQNLSLSVFNGLYVYQNNKFRSYLVDGIWKRKKFKHTINDKDQLILAAEFGDVFIVEDTSTLKVKLTSKDKIIGKTVLFLLTKIVS
jgi:hypothetical protein